MDNLQVCIDYTVSYNYLGVQLQEYIVSTS